MKTCCIVLTQEDQAGLFRVVSFSNTVQLSVGQTVDIERVERWCATPRVNVRVVGRSNPDAEQPQLDGGGHDALALPEVSA